MKPFLQIYEEWFKRQYGFSRSYVQKVIYRYLDCGDLHNCFSRVKCKDYGHEYLLSFSRNLRLFYPSCHKKGVVELGEWPSHISIGNKQFSNSLILFICNKY
ncbi:MAG: transposase zinc-binding domain-containing protein [Syntrophaceae bacterium]